MSINAYSSQKLENLEPDHKEKWDYNSYNLQFRIALDGSNNSMLSENEKRIKELCQELGQCLYEQSPIKKFNIAFLASVRHT